MASQAPTGAKNWTRQKPMAGNNQTQYTFTRAEKNVDKVVAHSLLNGTTTSENNSAFLGGGWENSTNTGGFHLHTKTPIDNVQSAVSAAGIQQ